MAECQFSTAVQALIRVARPEFRRPHDRVAFAVHAYFLCQGYTLVGVGPKAEQTVPAPDAAEVSLDGWNDNAELYIFVYGGKKELHPVVVKCVAMGNLMVVCASSLTPGETEPRTLNVDVAKATTQDDDVLKGYASVENLVRQFVKTLGEFKTNPATVPPPRPEPLLERPRLTGRLGGVPLTGEGSLVGMGDPRFTPHLRHPELQPRFPGARFDPIAPPGMQGYYPDDFTPPSRYRFHPDLAPPAPRSDFDPDNMFG